MTIDTNTHWYIIKFLGYKIAFENYTNRKNYNDNFSVYENRSFFIKDLSKNLSIDRSELTSFN